MDQTLLVVVVLVLAVSVVMGWLARIITRPQMSAGGSSGDSSIGVSTEGMKVCPKCGMGNLWMERRCSACGNPLKG
jgi:hypothetical protein